MNIDVTRFKCTPWLNCQR